MDGAVMDRFERQSHTIDGIETVVLAAGSGEPLVFFHGAGTFHGFAFALRWADRFRVIVPYHPGFGESADDERIDRTEDYVLHYLDLFDAMGLDRVRLAGFSLGGRLAAAFASQQRQRVERLALVAPAGLRVPEHRGADIFKLSADQLPRMLVSDFEVIRPHLPAPGDPDALVNRYREQTSTARLTWERPHDPKLPRWLRRLDMKTLIAWGAEDRILPVGQAEAWHRLIPHADVKLFAGAGHLVLDESAEAVQAVGEFMAG